jgi:DNA-binding MarR family transcriptional regulator
LVRVAEAIDRRFSALLVPLGVRPRHLHVLRYLHSQGVMSQQALAGGIRVDPGNLIATLDELEADGLIRREIDATDRRRRKVHLTAEGLRKLHQGIAASEQADNEVLGVLTQAQRASLHAAARRVYVDLRGSSTQSATD